VYIPRETIHHVIHQSSNVSENSVLVENILLYTERVGGSRPSPPTKISIKTDT